MLDDKVNRCVCCGEIIPEGRMVCPVCEREACMHLWMYEGLEPGTRRGHLIRWRCMKCGETRIERPVDRRIFWEE